MSFDHGISRICNSKIGEVILINDNTTLLDYRHHFIRSLNVVDSSHKPELYLIVIYIGTRV